MLGVNRKSFPIANGFLCLRRAGFPTVLSFTFAACLFANAGWIMRPCLAQDPIKETDPQPSLTDPQPSLTGQPADEDSTAVDFTRDIRPILSDTCFKCHGPDEEERAAGLRLDTEAGIQADLGGYQAVKAGDLANSELIKRILSDDPDLLMPPPESGRTLTEGQIEKLKEWVAAGANWKQHWSLVPPQMSQVPTIVPPADRQAWADSPIDQFLLRKILAKGLGPNPEADKASQLRRLSLDLIGLPPTPQELQSFITDHSADAYEKQVDRLLASPRFGEHMARFWLDAARYGDTHGLHLDNYREMWLYRDWVINAFNRNLAYDQFVIEQLAGDLLENPTQDQIIASGFNRSHVTTSEGGSITEEVDMRNVVDRTSTTGTVFMGLTVGCAVCHDHKYDPISQKEFYQLYAFFNSIDGNPLDGNIKDHAPVLRVLQADQQAKLAQLDDRFRVLEAELQQKVAAYEYSEPELAAEAPDAEPSEFVWVDDEVPQQAVVTDWNFVDAKDGPVLSGEKAAARSADGLTQHVFSNANPPLQIHAMDDVLFAYVYLDSQKLPSQIMLQWNDGNWDHRAFWGEDKIAWGTPDSPSRHRMGDLPAGDQWVRLEVKAGDVGLAAGAKINGWALTQFDGSVRWDKLGIVTGGPAIQEYRSLNRWIADLVESGNKEVPASIVDAAKRDAEIRTQDENQRLRDYFIENVYVDSKSQFAEIKAELKKIGEEKTAIENAAPTTLISKEMAEPKPAFILKRGEYDQPGEAVQRQTLAALPPMSDHLPRNRLGLAQWLTDPAHPLTARVTVNRFWQQVFGTGLVKTSEDFGAQGQTPSHPQLLDFLALDFINHQWDVKRLMKQLVMTAAYRQSTTVSQQAYAVDPENRFLSRAARYRLDAETLRDQALFAANLLTEEIGGPSVKPPQPDGLWFAVGYSGSNTVRFKKDEGHEKVHRRSLYTFWKRTSPPPQMATFDAPSRESCTVRRERTNTPLQALLLMNDPQYVEASRYLAQRILSEAGDSTAERIDFAMQTLVARTASGAERELLEKMCGQLMEEYQADPAAAEALISIGEVPAEKTFEPASLATWTMIANLILNLDEVVTKN